MNSCNMNCLFFFFFPSQDHFIAQGAHWSDFQLVKVIRRGRYSCILIIYWWDIDFSCRLVTVCLLCNSWATGQHGYLCVLQDRVPSAHPGLLSDHVQDRAAEWRRRRAERRRESADDLRRRRLHEHQQDAQIDSTRNSYHSCVSNCVPLTHTRAFGSSALFRQDLVYY